MIPQINIIEKKLKVALIGPPNVGKSTLINALTGQKIAIITHKPQTTRTSTLGIMTDGDTQIIFADTPGIFEPRKDHKLERFIVNNAIKTIKKIDISLLLIDAYLIQKIVEQKILDQEIESRLLPYRAVIKLILQNKKSINLFIVANKIDSLKDPSIINNLTQDNHQLIFQTITKGFSNIQQHPIIPISALKIENIDHLLSAIKPYAKESPWEFDAEQCTDISERTLAEEITREQLYLVMHAEIPYAVTIDTDQWQEQPDGSTIIYQSIIVLKASQKNMIIGARGQMIKTIGERARREITTALDRKVHLFLHVKVRAEWIDKLPM